MTTLSRIIAPSLFAVAIAAVAGASPSAALTAHDCSVKYQDAKKAGTLNGLKWNDFRKKECGGAGTAEEPKTEAKSEAPTPVVKPAKQETKAEAKAEAKAKATAPVTAAGAPVFPKVVDPKYAKESAGKARMHTCLDQYNANKAANGNGGHKWIEKGGGYYSLCNTALKS